MQKSSLLNCTLIAITIITMPTICMKSPLAQTEPQKFIVTLHLREKGQGSLKFNNECGFSALDEYACIALGIKWKKNTNRYWVKKALVRSPYTNMQNIQWTDESPRVLPQTTISDKFDNKDNRDVKFPSSLPCYIC